MLPRYCSGNPSLFGYSSAPLHFGGPARPDLFVVMTGLVFFVMAAPVVQFGDKVGWTIALTIALTQMVGSGLVRPDHDEDSTESRMLIALSVVSPQTSHHASHDPLSVLSLFRDLSDIDLLTLSRPLPPEFARNWLGPRTSRAVTDGWPNGMPTGPPPGLTNFYRGAGLKSATLNL
jgi:hypothetical protein